MSLSPEKFEQLCRLSRLDPDPETKARFLVQCNDMLGYMDKLAGLDAGGVEPLYCPVQHDALQREDVAERRRSREEILANAPETDGAFFVVPRILEGK